MFKSIAKKFHEWRGSSTESHRGSFMMVLLITLVSIGSFFFIPASGMSVTASKEYFFIIIGLVMALGYGISTLKQGEIRISKNPIFKVLGIILVVELIGSIMSPSFGISLIGHGFETSSWLFLFIFTVILLIAYRTIRSYEQVATVFVGALIGITVTVIFQLARFVMGGSHLSLGVLTSGTANLFGSWSDFGAVLGFIVMFCVWTLELGGLRKGIKWIVAILGLVSIAMLAFMDIRVIWIILGFISLASALYVFTFAFWDSESKTYRKNRNIPWYSLMIVIISIACIFFGNVLNSIASHHELISSNDVRLSIATTARVGITSIIHNPATGYGPNTFSSVWNMSKPPIVSGTNFSTTQFAYGSGYITTQMATNGILGLVGWIALIGLIIWFVIKSLAKGFNSSLDRYVVTLLSGSILLLLVMMFFMVVSSYLLILFGVLLGSFMGITSEKNNESEVVTSFMNDPRTSFFGILGITLLIVVIIFALYIETRKMIGGVYAVKGVNAESAQNLEGAVNDFTLATAFAQDDLYDRELSALTVEKVNQLTSTITQANHDVVAKQAESILGTALSYAQSAVAINSADYQNWIAEGNIYRTLVTLGISDAAGNAATAYTQAQKRNPHDPEMFLLFAQLDLAQSDTDGALSKIVQSINYYPTTEAYILRAQIQISKQDYSDAIVSMTEALRLDPYNATTAYQLGLLFYQQNDYAHAISAFKVAIYDNGSFGLAYGYLGVSYEKSGDITDANTIYAYMRTKSDQADTLINQIKNGATTTTSSTSSTNSGQTSTSTLLPSTSKSTPKQVAPTAKKK